MTIKATADNCTPPAGHGSFRFLTEASDLGLPPGAFPESIETDLGNGQPFIKCSACLESFLYKQQFGCIELRVFND